MKLTHEILIALEEKYYLQYCDSYGEPGYTTDKDGILFGNWNDVPETTAKRLERSFELEWYDEWYIDYNRSKCYRTQGDSYHWTPSVVFFDCSEPITIDDAKDDPESYLEFLHNNSERAECFDLDLESLGYEKVNTDYYESGWYGCNDSPDKILSDLLTKDSEGIYIFANLRQEQFRTMFDVYRKVS